LNPVSWWNSLTTAQQASILAQRKTVWLTLNSAIAWIVAAATTAGVFNDNDHFLAWWQKGWIVFTLTFFYTTTTSVVARRNDPPPPIATKGP
jgi:hypothetical protein